MKVSTAIIILTTLEQIGELPCMRHNIATIVFWCAPLSRATVWRYLKTLAQMGYVHTIEEDFRNSKATMYYITEKGSDYLERIKDRRKSRDLA